MDAIRTEALTKHYRVGFWRPRPYVALDALTLEVHEGRSLWLPRTERRRQDHHAQAADAADLPDIRSGRDSGAPGWRRRRPPPHRLPARESVLLRLSHRRGAARVLRRPVWLSWRGAEDSRGATAGRGRHRRRASAAAAEVLQRDAAARRHRASDSQRTGTGLLR